MAVNKVVGELTAYLDKKQVPYELITHKEVFTSLDQARVCKVKEKEVVKVILLETEKKKLVAALLPADLMAKLKKVKAEIGAKSLSMASEKTMKSTTGCPPGALPAVVSLYKLPAIADELLSKSKTALFRAGDYNHSIRMATSDLLSLINPTVTKFSVVPSPVRKKKKTAKLKKKAAPKKKSDKAKAKKKK